LRDGVGEEEGHVRIRPRWAHVENRRKAKLGTSLHRFDQRIPTYIKNELLNP
jgi:hypothetical protein